MTDKMIAVPRELLDDVLGMLKRAYYNSPNIRRIDTLLREAAPPADEELRRDAGPTAAARDVLAERQRQIEAEGWTPEHDDENESCDMARAAACYALSAAGYRGDDQAQLRFWPWLDSWWKPTTPRRDLVKAGALILAEIERLDRAAEKRENPHD